MSMPRKIATARPKSVAAPQPAARKSVATKLFAQKQVKLVSITRGHARLLRDLVHRGAGANASDVIKRSIEERARKEGINF